MKKLLFKILLVMIICCFSFLDVKADGDFNQISHVTSLDINKDTQKMTIKGFAFIDHMDNYGGVNLRSTIVAKNSSNDSVSYEVNYIKTGKLDYYHVRCQQTSTGAQVCNDSYANSLRGANRRSNTCNNDATKTSDCAYFDVEFEVVIDLQQLYNELGSAKEEISFSITTVNDIGASITNPIGVHPANCSVNGIVGMCGNQIDFNGSTIGISTSSNILVTATYAKARYENYSYADFYYEGTYGALGHQKDVSFRNKYGANFRSNYYIVNRNGTRYIIFDSWVMAKEALKIVFGGAPKVERPDIKCDLGYVELNATKEVTCGGSKEFKGCVDKSVNFGSLTYKLNSTQAAEIVNPDDSSLCGNNLSVDVGNLGLTILIHQYGNFTLPNITLPKGDKKLFAGRSFIFPNLSYYNYFYWKYARTESNNIAYTATAYYGKWEAEYEDVAVEVAVVDEDGNTVYNLDGTPVTTIEYESQIVGYTCDSTGNSYDLELTDIVDGDKGEQSLLYYLKYFSTKTVKDNIHDASHYSQEIIEQGKPASYDSNDENDSMVDPVAGKWKRDIGSWYSYEILEEGAEHKYDTQYTFDLDDAYIKVVGNEDRADITYVKPSVDDNYIKITDNKYFVPLKYPDNRDFPVTVNLSPISFVKNIDWNIFGNCQINVTNKVFGPHGDPGEPRLKVVYRPIDLQEPFPKGKDRQWNDWYKGSNVNRIKNTMSRSPIYKITLREGNSKDGILGLIDLNKINVNYNDWTGINKNGYSNFIIDDFSSYFTKRAPISDSYCKIGYFKSSCDELR